MPVTRCAECGAPAQPHSCAELFDVVLALDHSRRPPWGPLHAVTVACFLLQHPRRTPAAAQPLQAVLHAYLYGGLDAVSSLTERRRRANNHRNRGAAIPGGAPAPARTTYSVTIADVAQDGTFPAAGFADRVAAWARAVLDD